MTEKEFNEAKQRFDNALLINYLNGTLFKDKKKYTITNNKKLPDNNHTNI